MSGVKISGVGKGIPDYILTNDELATVVETSDEWIRTRTGIKTRHISKGESTTDLAIKAAKAALEDAKMQGSQIDLIIVATITPDEIMPSTACMVQEAIGAKGATAFDITAACSGFMFASKIAAQFIQGNLHQNALIIGAEVLSKTLDWQDRATCVLFGDGAGAVIYTKHHKNNILGLYSGSDGEKGACLTLSGRSLSNPYIQKEQATPYMFMDGREVYRFATTIVPQCIHQVLNQAERDLEEVSLFILHQANERIMDSVAKRLGVDSAKFFKNLDKYGNTSAASIPIALSEAKALLKPGDLVVLCGFGGGLTWGSMLVEW